MGDLQKYQKYRMKKESSGSKVFKFVLWLIIIVVFIWILKGCFGGEKKSVNTNTANENVNAASNLNDNINSNNKTNLNLNTNTNLEPVSTNFDLENCTAVFSRGQDRQEVVLTFNSASSIDNLSEIIDILKSNSVPGSFFITGEVIEENSNDINNLVNQGFGVYNLSYDYSHLADLSSEEIAEELEKTEEALQEATGASTKPFFRPPYGETGGEVFDTALEEGYCTVTWTVDAFDWDTDQTAQEAQSRVLDSLKEGTIVVMQVGTDLVPQFLPDLINEVKNKGYQFVDLPTVLTP
ncbi:MAG: polysaccharide deacetylase family protein [Patescibacteria group bacterium]|nr:polysaccharide deacetylase family protein [Patescibacteria group bacterium]